MSCYSKMMKKTTYADLTTSDRNLIDAAEAAMSHGYSPYTKFFVGASVLTRSGKVYTGANVETASYVAICAERAALSAAVTGGDYEYEAIAVICKSDFFDVKEVAGPCGICRQLLFEFSQVAEHDIRVINCTTNKEGIIIATISELIPLCWGPSDTETDVSKYRLKRVT